MALELHLDNPRYKSGTVLTLTHRDDGWHVEAQVAFAGGEVVDADRRGEPAFYKALEHDSIKWPAQTPRALERIWHALSDGEWNEDYAQKKLDELGTWINATTTGYPAGWFDE